jgi:hypothetical protein
MSASFKGWMAELHCSKRHHAPGFGAWQYFLLAISYPQPIKALIPVPKADPKQAMVYGKEPATSCGMINQYFLIFA